MPRVKAKYQVSLNQIRLGIGRLTAPRPAMEPDTATLLIAICERLERIDGTLEAVREATVKKK